jgi:hypothetical protein
MGMCTKMSGMYDHHTVISYYGFKNVHADR